MCRDGSRAAATSKMERFVIIVNGFQPLTIITKHSILDFAAVLDPPLHVHTHNIYIQYSIYILHICSILCIFIYICILYIYAYMLCDIYVCIYVYICMYIYMCIYIYIYIYICGQHFRSLGAHQRISDQMKIFSDQGAQTAARAVGIAYCLWIPFSIDGVLSP